MKTKHILTALTLPAMFAACTADDVVSQNNGLQQGERAKLSKDFVLNVNDGVKSRYAVEGSTSLEFVFEEGDLIGANLIDAFDPGYEGFDVEDPATWPIVNAVAPALPFEYKEGVWKSAGELGVGNYLFTNPYNPEDKNRAAAKYELPVIVKYDAEDPEAHIENYNKAVAATILREGETQANISLKNLFTYPKIVINFPKADEVAEVDKVILKKESGFIVKGALHHQDIVEMNNPKEIETYLKANEGKTEADYWAQFETSDFVVDTKDEIADYNGYAEITTSPYIIYEMNQAVAANSFEVRLMLPSIENLKDAGNEELEMYIVTDKGGYKVDLADANSYAFKESTLEAKIKKALSRNSSNTLKVDELTKVTEYELNGLNIDNIVSDAEDWNALVAKYGDLEKYSAEYNASEATDAEELEVNIINSEFALNSELEMPAVAEFVIKSNVSVKGNVTLKNIKVEGGKLIVEKGATLTTDATLKAEEVCVKEGAELVFTAEKDKKGELMVYDGIAKVCNHGTVTVPAGVIAEFELNNAKDAVLNVGAESRAAEAVEAIANLSGTNDGIINNYSVINADVLTNNAPTEKAGYEWNSEKKAWDGVPTIDNNGTYNAKGKTVNSGLFNNSGVLTSSFVGEAYFNNETLTGQSYEYKATLAIARNAETYIDTNKGSKIVLAELNPAKFTIHNAKNASAYAGDDCGEIVYTMNDKSANTIDLSTSPVTYLITNVGIELTKTYNYLASGATVATVKALPNLQVNAGTVKISTTKNTASAYVAQVENLIINGEVNVDGEIASVSNIKINADAVLGVPAGAKLNVAGFNEITTVSDSENEKAETGKLAVNGAMHLTGVTTDSGIYTGEIPENKNIVLHKGVVITCAKTPAAVNEVVNRDVNFNGGTLKELKSQSDYKAVDSNDTYTLYINSELDMLEEDNIANVAVLNKAEVIVLNGGNIVGLKGSVGADVATLEVAKASTIKGTEKVVVLKADKLVNKAGLVIEGGYIEMNVAAAIGMGCEAIENTSALTGTIVAKNANSEYLYWNAESKIWASEGANVTIEGTVLASTMAQITENISGGGTFVLANNVSGDGLKLVASDKATVVIDLNGKILDVSDDAVGSEGTKTQGLHFEKGNTVTIKNGTIKATSDKVKMLIQNYANLTLENVTLEFENGNYALSNNCGKVTIDGCVFNVGEGNVALDVYNSASYTEGTQVEIKGNTTINGNIEYGADKSLTTDSYKSTLTFTGNSIVLNGKLVYTESLSSNNRWSWALENAITGENSEWL